MTNTFKKILRTIIGAFVGIVIAAGWFLYESILRNMILNGNMDSSLTALIVNAVFGLIMGGVLINKIKINIK